MQKRSHRVNHHGLKALAAGLSVLLRLISDNLEPHNLQPSIWLISGDLETNNLVLSLRRGIDVKMDSAFFTNQLVVVLSLAAEESGLVLGPWTIISFELAAGSDVVVVHRLAA